MNRLTIRNSDGAWDVPLRNDDGAYIPSQEIIDRLAAYEDTGLEPDEVRGIKTAYDEVQIPYEVVATGADAARVIRLLDAEDEGRLLVLPCKVGDTVFSAFENEGVFCGKVYAISTCDGTNWFSVRYDGGLRYDHTWDEIGKTVFFAREDAEKALGGMKNELRCAIRRKG